MSTVSDLRALGAPVAFPVALARFISDLDLSGQQKARLLRDYLDETGARLNAEVLVAARDYSFYL